MKGLVRCADCVHFQRDEIGDGTGIGLCKHPKAPVDLPDNFGVELCYDSKHGLHTWKRGPLAMPLFPNIERRCPGYSSKGKVNND